MTIHAADARRPALQLRRLTVLLLAGAFLVLAVSGTILFFGPHGPVSAEASRWLFGMNRLEWRAIHGAMAGLFGLAALWHAWLNRKPLLTYLKQPTGSHLRVSPEVYAAVTVIIVVLFAAWMGWIPWGLQEGGGGGPGMGLGRGRLGGW